MSTPQHRTAQLRLAVLTGDLTGPLSARIGACSTPPRLEQPIPIGDGAELLQRRPDIRPAERNLAATSARLVTSRHAVSPWLRRIPDDPIEPLRQFSPHHVKD